MKRIIVIMMAGLFVSACATGIHRAVGYQDLSKVRKYIENGTYINSVDNHGNTPIILAAYYGNSPIANYLCEKGANVDSQNEDGWTALLYAVYYGHSDIVKILLDHNACVSKINKFGYTALDYAEKSNHKDIVKMIASEKAMECEVLDEKIITKPAVKEIYRIGIFPWINSAGVVMENIDYTLDNIIEQIEREKLFELSYSFYKTDRPKYDRNNMRISYENRFWQGRKPYMLGICDYAEDLNLDAVLVGTYAISFEHGLTDLRIYLIDVKSKRQISGFSPYPSQSRRDSLLIELFEKYKTRITLEK